jgi:hypothetical protein
MKVIKSLFLVLALSVLGYSAVEAGAQDLIADDDSAATARKCCQYQADCPADSTCKSIYPECSKNLPHICVKNTATTVVVVDKATP